MSHSQPQATTQSHCNSSVLYWMNGSGSVNSNPIPPITAECSMEAPFCMRINFVRSADP